MPNRKVYKTYLAPTKGNRAAFDVLNSKKWKDGSIVVLPPIRVLPQRHTIYGHKYKVYIHRKPGPIPYIPRRSYIIHKVVGESKTWKLEFIDISKLPKPEDL